MPVVVQQGKTAEEIKAAKLKRVAEEWPFSTLEYVIFRCDVCMCCYKIYPQDVLDGGAVIFHDAHTNEISSIGGRCPNKEAHQYNYVMTYERPRRKFWDAIKTRKKYI